MAYACLSASEEEHPVSTMSSRWKRMVMSKVTRMWATSAWKGQPPLDEAAPIDDFYSVFGGQGRRMAVIVPQGHGRPGSSPPDGGNAGTRSNNPKTGGGTPRATTRLWSPGGPKGPPRPAAGSVPVMGGGAASPLDGADVVTIIRTMMEAQSASNMAMSAAYNANMIAFHTATAQALAA
jgi:hypothetical protein